MKFLINKINKSILKKLTVITLVMMVAGASIACSDKKNNTSSQANEQVDVLDQIKESGKIRVGTAPGYPPFEFVQAKDGKSEVLGADIDLAKKIAEKLDVALDIKTMDFDALLPALQAGKVDIVITGMTPNEKRKKAVDFSDIYFTGANSVIVKSDFAKEIKTSDDLKNYKVGLQKGSTQEEYVNNILKVENSKSLTSVPDLITDLKNGNIDAILTSMTVAKINEKQNTGIKVINNVDLKGSGSEETAAIAVKKGENKKLISEMNSVIKELKDSGEYEKILNKNIDLSSK
ncbi:MAG: transporter substrate-binding domain-containing protein [Peptostreptococcus sp.]|uniref:transporter substrate-binding domain-containing protein n=1 Tax=Peptostreptococcus sp. TaxID=1262 RepID=UPI002FC7155A